MSAPPGLTPERRPVVSDPEGRTPSHRHPFTSRKQEAGLPSPIAGRGWGGGAKTARFRETPSPDRLALRPLPSGEAPPRATMSKLRRRLSLQQTKCLGVQSRHVMESVMLIPHSGGTLWDRYYTAAPRPGTPSGRRYGDRKLRSKRWRPRTASTPRPSPSGGSAPSSRTRRWVARLRVQWRPRRSKRPSPSPFVSSGRRRSTTACPPRKPRSSPHRLFQRRDVSRPPGATGRRSKVQAPSNRLLSCRHRRGPRGGRQAAPRRRRPDVQARVRAPYAEAGRKTAPAFLEALIAAAPYEIHPVPTGDGVRFACRPSRRDGPAARHMTMHSNGVRPLRVFSLLAKPWAARSRSARFSFSSSSLIP